MEQINNILASLPKVGLGIFPTPLHRLGRLEEECGFSGIFIKRDDLTGLGPGGNKTRPLEYILGDGVANGRKTIIASGPPQSNLCALAASACAKIGLRCVLVHNGVKPKELRGNLLLNHILGAETHFIGEASSQERAAYVQELYDKLNTEGASPYVILNGATTGRGILGYINVIAELKEQKNSVFCPGLHTVFAPGGNGGVAAGFIYGNVLLGMPFQIVIVSVEYDKQTLNGHIESVIREASEILGMPFDFMLDDVCVITDEYRGDGWGVSTPESTAEVFGFAQAEGIFLENIYNSKVLVGMKDWINKGKATSDVCYLHTGGFGSLFGQF